MVRKWETVQLKLLLDREISLAGFEVNEFDQSVWMTNDAIDDSEKLHSA